MIRDEKDELICLKCGGLIEHDDTYNISCDEDYYVNYCVGHCVNCEQEYQWQAIYIFKKIESLEEVH